MTVFNLEFSAPTSQDYRYPDKEGRRQFTLTWFDPSFHEGPRQRGQLYFAVVEEHLRRGIDSGHSYTFSAQDPYGTQSIALVAKYVDFNAKLVAAQAEMVKILEEYNRAELARLETSIERHYARLKALHENSAPTGLTSEEREEAQLIAESLHVLKRELAEVISDLPAPASITALEGSLERADALLLSAGTL